MSLSLSSSDVSLWSHGSSTVLSSEQLIENLRRQQQQQQHASSEYLASSYQQDPPPARSNVYRPRTMIGTLLHRDYTTSTIHDGNDPHHFNITQPQELLLAPSHSRNLKSCLTSPRVLFTIAVCGILLFNLLLGNFHLLEQWWEMGIHGMSAQRTAHLSQAKLLPSVPKLDLKPLKLQPTDGSKIHSSKATASHPQDSTNSAIDGCEATIMLVRHCEKGGLKSHCSFMGYERSVYLATLFGDDKRWPAPSQIYALNKGRTHKLNYREVETVQTISDTVGVPINRDYSTLDTKALSHDLLEQLLEGELCGKLVLISWKHSDIPKLAQHLGCGPLQGCPWDYRGKDFDSTWQIR
jgi:hypothetical protein